MEKLRMVKVTENCPDITEAVKVVEIEDSVKSFDDEIDCHGYGGHDITSVPIGEINYAVIVDDAGVLKGRMVTILNQDRSRLLAGNALICKAVPPDLVSLSDEDVANIHRHIREMRKLSDRTICYVVECDNLEK